jgi:hypothetical protein
LKSLLVVLRALFLVLLLFLLVNIGVVVTGWLGATRFVEGTVRRATMRHASATKEVGTKTEGVEVIQPEGRFIVVGHRSRGVLWRVCMFLSTFMFLITTLREEGVAVALLLKASEEVPEGSGLIHIGY